MKRLGVFRYSLALAAALLCAVAARAAVLYDATLNTLPAAQGWLSGGIGPVTHGAAGGIYSFDSTALTSTQWGHSQTLSATPLDTNQGFDLSFSLRVVSEDHGANLNRAGFSVLFTGQDPTHALELAFWSNRVWAYHYDAQQVSPFVQGVGVAIDATQWTSYTVQVRQQSFSVLAGPTLLMSGALENYTAQGAPYSASNFIFFGDDTSSARASVQIGVIALSPVPEASSALMMLVGVLLIPLRSWRRRTTGTQSSVRSVHSSGNSTTSSMRRR